MANTKNLKQFKKGQSGNPSGRPKGSLNLKTILSKLLELPAPKNLLKETREFDPEASTVSNVLAVNLVKLALAGNSKALEMVWYYDSGKPKDTIAIEENFENEKIQELIKEINAERFSENFKK